MFENDNYDDIVNEYINGSLNDSQIADFEKVLATNETLQTELKKAQLIQKLTQSHKLTQIHSLLEENRCTQKQKDMDEYRFDCLGSDRFRSRYLYIQYSRNY